MQTSPFPFWLMIVSIAIAVLPVCRSPMISSRWPRPIGMSASIALMPVWTGVSTDLRTMTPGAMRSTGRRALGWIRARAAGRPAGGRLRRHGAVVAARPAERVDDAAEQRLADGHLDDAARGLDRVAFLDVGCVAGDDRAARLPFRGHSPPQE